MIATKIQNYLLKSFDIRLLGFILSLFMSALWFCYHQPINVDGMLYLQAAQKFIDEGFKASMAIYSWPFYPIIIALLSIMTGLSVVTSAYFLTSLLIAFIIVNFITVIKDLGGDKITQIIACFMILMFPTLAHERYEIFRDFGYYAFGLLSIHYLLLYQNNAKLRFALIWGLTSCIATLFRIEGLVFQFVMPFILFFSRHIIGKQRILYVIKAQSVNLCLLVLLLILYFTHASTQDWGRLSNFLSSDNLAKLSENFASYLLIIKTNFNVFIAQDAKTILISAMVGIAIKNILVAITPINAFLSCYGFNLVPWQKDQKLIIYGYIILNVIIIASFVWSAFFLVTRYVLFLALLFLLFVPFTVKAVIERWQRNKQALSENIRIGCVMLGLAFLSLNSIFLVGANKSYIIEAGNWIKTNTNVNARLFTTEIKLIYYADRPGSRYPDDFPYGVGVNFFTIKNIDFKKYDYAAIAVTKNYIPEALKLFKEFHLETVKTFTNNKEDVIYILKTTSIS
jgi:hypothetical protein